MKNTFTKLAVVAALSITTSAVFAATGNVSASATVGTAATFTPGATLNFGTVIRPTSGSETAILSQGNNMSGTATTTGNSSVGTFTIGGANAAVVDLSFSGGPTYTLSGQNGSQITLTPTLELSQCTIGTDCDAVIVHGQVAVASDDDLSAHTGNVVIDYTYN